MLALRILTVIVLSLGLAACGGDDEEGKDTEITTQTTTGGEKTEGTATSLKALLSGTEEVPGPGVKDGVGAALIDIAGSKVCADLNVTMGEKPLKAHIHKGAKGASGPVVVDLVPVFNPGEAAFTSKSCVETTADSAAQLIADPGAFYVNVHSGGYPDGAMRGQLAKV
ncbi:MAG TPA: CHRD domain-containing protein [Acidimicrobiia bacterium]|nr:CHRD domain-containing protein [Acidimicrobiia bacterium]